jgi:ribose 5-phosphate isomerase
VDHEQEKQQAAYCAVEYVRSGMTVGLGAGSTALLATRRIAQLLAERRDAISDRSREPDSRLRLRPDPATVGVGRAA